MFRSVHGVPMVIPLDIVPVLSFSLRVYLIDPWTAFRSVHGVLMVIPLDTVYVLKCPLRVCLFDP